jgi:tRNA pseudouridine38-40 synthase
LRYFIELSYKGTHYNGWQIQPNAKSIQQTIEEAISVLLREKIKITGAGRTDAGVHARQMFAHFDTNQSFNSNELTYKLNSFLPQDIAIYNIFPVPQDAHARFDALSRSYEYYIHTKKDPFLNDLSWYYKTDLNIDKMNEAAKFLFKHKDFKSFSKSKTDVKTYICDIKEAFWEKNDHQLVFYITADRFLRNMVRAIVGTLVEVGQGKKSIEEFDFIIKQRDRNKAGFSVPAKGLFLTKIEYPSKIIKNDND